MRARLVLLAAGLLMVTPPLGAQEGPDDRPSFYVVTPHDDDATLPRDLDLDAVGGRFQGGAFWIEGPPERPPGTGSWTVLEGQVVAFHLRFDAHQYLCTDGRLLAAHGNTTLLEGFCVGIARNTTTAQIEVLWDHPPANTTARWVATLQADPDRTILLSLPGPPSSVPGYVLLVVAGALLVTTLALTWAYHNERRIARYLVRRLFEETKGQVPAEWPGDLRHKIIARFLARGKN